MAIPLTVVSGYLGAGKTTLINRIISGAQTARLCVIVNDFGDLSIDAEILRRSDGLTLPLTNGCMCCSAVSGSYTALNTALGMAPERILIEASGVADPARLSAVAAAEPELEPAGVFTVVDCTAFAADIGDALKGPDILRQVRAASTVLLSRCDLGDAAAIARVHDLLSVLAPGAPVRRADRVATLAQLAALSTGVADSVSHDIRAHRAEERYVSCSVFCSEVHDLDGFITAVRAMKPPPLRLKGLVLLQGASAPVLVNMEHGKVRLEPVALSGFLTQTMITAVFPRASDGKAVLESLAHRHLS
jgi:G3E family GTPase